MGGTSDPREGSRAGEDRSLREGAREGGIEDKCAGAGWANAAGFKRGVTRITNDAQ